MPASQTADVPSRVLTELVRFSIQGSDVSSVDPARPFFWSFDAVPLGAIFRASLWDETGITASAAILKSLPTSNFSRRSGTPLIISTWVGAMLAVISRRALLAWLVTRTDPALEKPIRALVMASFVTPPFLGAFAWTLLRRPQCRFSE